MAEIVSFEELSGEVDVPRHIIHLWTKKFPILSPQRSNDGKIGFKNRDVAFARGLKHLLISEKHSITEVQTLLNERGFAHIIDIGKTVSQTSKNQDLNLDIKNSQEMQSQKKINNTVKFDFDHKKIAKQAFNNLHNIFSRDKHKKITENTELDNIEIPDIDSVVTKSEDVIINFEDNWRHLMEKTGKATPIECVRDKSNTIDNHLFSDIWEIDDEVDLFDDEPIIHTPPIVIENTKKPIRTETHVPFNHAPMSSGIPKQEIPATEILSQGLSIEKIEKIRHLIAKLDIMRDELVSANIVITKTLKAFGYSGFENAYNKFD